MSDPALRSFAVAGAFAATLIFGGLTAAPALADDPSDTGGSSQDGTGTGGGSEAPGDGSAAPAAPAAPDEPADGGAAEKPDDVEVSSEPAPAESGRTRDPGGRADPVVDEPAPTSSPSPYYRNSISIPVFRLPAIGEIPAGSWPSVSNFSTTIRLPVPTLGEFLKSLHVVPTPAPAPGPQFRTQEEAPVADAATGTTGGGGGGGTMSEPTVFHAPLVTVPRAVTIAGKPPRTTPGVPATTPGPRGVTQPGAAGVRTPAIRGSVPPTPGASVRAAAPSETMPMGGSAPMGGSTSVGAYPRSVMNPTVAEIAAVAVPGVAGLLFLTFSGGVIGYRQANSVRFVRTAGADRFLP
jgi:hypothetical protein